jgi:hypothetical protein
VAALYFALHSDMESADAGVATMNAVSAPRTAMQQTCVRPIMLNLLLNFSLMLMRSRQDALCPKERL